jgi:hypothetical protein
MKRGCVNEENDEEITQTNIECERCYVAEREGIEEMN